MSTEELKLLDISVKFGVPIITFIAGFLVSRFTMSKKERKDYEIQLLETSRELIEEQGSAFEEFALSIYQYANKEEQPNLDDFFAISSKGALYFNRIKITCDAIIANKVDDDSIRNTIVPKVKEAIERSLPDFHKTLRDIADKDGIKYTGELKRENYESMYTVYEMYS